MKRSPLPVALVLAISFGLLTGGCFLGTPREELEKLGATFETLPGGVALSLADKDFRDDDVPYLGALTTNHPDLGALVVLDLSNTQITDRGLARLINEPLPSLRRLDLTGTRCTETAISAARTRLPHCEVLP